jgi:hypothetical protein
MKRDIIKKLQSSFLSCEKDTQTILEKLFVQDRKHGDELKRYLVINTKDCMDLDNQDYNKIISEMSVSDLYEKGYIRINPKLSLPENEEIKSYILITFDSFSPSGNSEFRDCLVRFDIICHTDYWDIGNFAQRPLKIAGYIDGLLNKTKLSGIGELLFAGCNELVLDENLSGYSLVYAATHGSDDVIPGGEF